MPKLCLEKKFNKISFSVGKKKIKKNSVISSETVVKFPKKSIYLKRIFY